MCARRHRGTRLLSRPPNLKVLHSRSVSSNYHHYLLLNPLCGRLGTGGMLPVRGTAIVQRLLPHTQASRSLQFGLHRGLHHHALALTFAPKLTALPTARLRLQHERLARCIATSSRLLNTVVPPATTTVPPTPPPKPPKQRRSWPARGLLALKGIAFLVGSTVGASFSRHNHHVVR